VPSQPRQNQPSAETGVIGFERSFVPSGEPRKIGRVIVIGGDFREQQADSGRCRASHRFDSFAPALLPYRGYVISYGRLGIEFALKELDMGTLPLKMPVGPAHRSGTREFLQDIDPGYQRLRHVAKTGLAVVLAALMFEFDGPGGPIIAAICSLILMQCAFGRTLREQWRSMLIGVAVQLAILAVVILVSPVPAIVGMKAALAIAGSLAISVGIHFFLWPWSNRAAFVAALQLQCEHTARCLDALSAFLVEPNIRSRRQACMEHARVRNALAFNQHLIDERMAAPVLEAVRPVIRSMYEALECLAILDRTAAALSLLNSVTENVRAEVASGLREFATGFRDLHREPPNSAGLLGCLQMAAASAPVQSDEERLLLIGTVFWMRRMDALYRQFAREIATLPAEIIPQQ
jgi:hypothetical protein